MKTSEAESLIRAPSLEWTRAQSWCDLGCGSGTFTVALANLLPCGSSVLGVDLDAAALGRVPDESGGVTIRKVIGDIRSSSLRLPPLDGALMANSLHFVRDQEGLLRRLLAVTSQFLVVEYERSKPSPWGPFPVGFEKLNQLFQQVGVEHVEKVSTLRSRFGGTIYSAFARKSLADERD